MDVCDLFNLVAVGTTKRILLENELKGYIAAKRTNIDITKEKSSSEESAQS